jgi:hypothetical protein
MSNADFLTPDPLPADAQAVPEPSGPELAQLLRESFPEINVSDFEEDTRPMSADGLRSLRKRFPDIDDEEAERLRKTGIYSRCGVLMAFSFQFNRWVREGKADPVRRALGLIDQFLAESPPVPPGTRPGEVGDQFHNSLLACFVENIMNTTPAFRSLVLPNLGPAIRAHLEEHDPFWLQEPRETRAGAISRWLVALVRRLLGAAR